MLPATVPPDPHRLARHLPEARSRLWVSSYLIPASLLMATAQSQAHSLLQPCHPPSRENGLFPDLTPGNSSYHYGGATALPQAPTPAVTARLELFCHLLVTPNLLFLSGRQDGNWQGQGVADGESPSSLASTTSPSRPESVPTFWSLMRSTVPPFWG